MKPTVSETRMRGLVSGCSARTVVSSVAKSLSSTSTWLPGERAHERRLAGVRVADERDAELVLARLAAVLLLLLDGGELLAQLGDAVADLAPVELDRRLARALAALALLAARRLAQARRDVRRGARSRPGAAPRGCARGGGRCRR